MEFEGLQFSTLASVLIVANALDSHSRARKAPPLVSLLT